MRYHSRRAQKGAERIEQAPCLAIVPAPQEDTIERDKICMRLSASLWLWIAVSRRVGQVLGFAPGDRTDAMLARCWSDVPEENHNKPVHTDRWGAYGRFFAAFAAGLHQACDKGTGETSHAEAGNTTAAAIGHGAPLLRCESPDRQRRVGAVSANAQRHGREAANCLPFQR
jgi:IS1 family transposase